MSLSSTKAERKRVVRSVLAGMGRYSAASKLQVVDLGGGVSRVYGVIDLGDGDVLVFEDVGDAQTELEWRQFLDPESTKHSKVRRPPLRVPFVCL